MIASFFGVSLDYLMGVSASPLPKSPEWQDADEFEAELDERPESVWVPVIGRVAAGFRKIMNEEILGFEPVDYDLAESGRFFALRIAGDSMEPEISSGDIIALRQIPDWRFLVYGEIYAIVTRNDLRTVKRLGPGSTPDTFTLIPTNKSPEYVAQEIEKADILHVYQVIGCMKKF